MRGINLLFLTFLACTIFGCEEDVDPCDLPGQGEQLTLSSHSLQYMSPFTGASRLIYTTNGGEEVSFDVSYRDTLVSYGREWRCESDTSEMQFYMGTAQFQRVDFINENEFPDGLQAILYKVPGTTFNEGNETFAIGNGSLLTFSYSSEDHYFNYNVDHTNEHILLSDSLVIGNKTFYSVYEYDDPSLTPQLKVKYTMNEGIVHIINSSTQKEYIFDRKE